MKNGLLFLLLLGMLSLTYSCGEDEEPIVEVDLCTDGIQNGEETDVDCGGTCDACPTPEPTREYYMKGYVDGKYKLLQEGSNNRIFTGSAGASGCTASFGTDLADVDFFSGEFAEGKAIFGLYYNEVDFGQDPFCDLGSYFHTLFPVGEYPFSEDGKTIGRSMYIFWSGEDGVSWVSGKKAQGSTAKFELTGSEQVFDLGANYTRKLTGRVVCKLYNEKGDSIDIDVEFVHKIYY